MSNFFKVAVLALIMMATVYPQATLVHHPIYSAERNSDIEMEARVKPSQNRVVMMQMYYKTPEQRSYQHINMRKQGDSWSAGIPANQVRGTLLQYFITALLDNQTVITFPQYNPYNQPARIVIEEKAESKEQSKIVSKDSTVTPPPASSRSPADVEIPQNKGSAQSSSFEQTQAADSSVNKMQNAAAESPFLILSPEPFEEVKEKNILFAVSILDTALIDYSTLRLYHNGKNVTFGATISDFVITYQAQALTAGNHLFKVSALDTTHTVPVSKSLSIAIGEPSTTRPPSYFSGQVFSDLRQESISKQSENIAIGGGSFRGYYGDIEYNGRFFLTSLDNKTEQPRNRFHFSVRSKWAGLFAGDTYPRYNDLILWGKRVRGIEGYLRLGFLNLDLVYGQTNRAAEGSLIAGAEAFLQNQTAIQDTLISGYGTYEQNLFAVRSSFGSGKHFQLGFTFAKVKDDPGSIQYGSNPKENVVLGPDLKIALHNARIVLHASSAVSLTTQDISNGAVSADELEDLFGDVSLPFDPIDYDHVLTINTSTTPLDPSKGTSLAYNVGIRFTYFNNLLKIGYKSIGAEYNSLANTWIRKDIQGFYFRDRIRLFSNKLYGVFSYENYQDNFSSQDINPEIDLKTFNYSLHYYPGAGLPHMGASLRTHSRNNGITSVQTDTISYGNEIDPISIDNRLNQMQRDLSIFMGYNFRLANLDHHIRVDFISGNRRDRFDDKRDSLYFSQDLTSSVGLFSLRTRVTPKLNATLNFARNNNLAGKTSEYEYTMFGVGADYLFYRDKIQAFAQYQTILTEGQSYTEQSLDYSRNFFRVGTTWFISPAHRLSIEANIFRIHDKSDFNNGENYTDSIVRLFYEKYF